MESWAEVILKTLPHDGRPVARLDLEVLCSQEAAQSLDMPAFSDALKTLLRRKLVQRDATSLWRTEPDFEERALEQGAEQFLGSDACLDALRVTRESFVLEKTTTAQGAPGAGKWSRPDFTMAAIRRFKFDPRRYLDVFSFELKNRRGTNVVAVHEALAHGRFAHFAYLICPRAELSEAEANIVRQSCTDHGVGLITFRLSVADNERPSLTEFRFEVSPQRRTPDPASVDLHLESRLTVQASNKLMQIAARP